MKLSEEVIRLFPEHLRFIWQEAAQRADSLCEIRLRVKKPVLLYFGDEEWFVSEAGELTRETEKARILSGEELGAILKHICHYSLYACEKEMRRGFVSADGGFRVGIAGEVIMDASGCVKNVSHICSMNIRIARQVKGAALPVLPFLYEKKRLRNALLISPPGCGKTTLLRDIIRLVSDGNGYGAGQTVGLVDERSEIAGCFQGFPGNDVGCRTDVLDGCPKGEGLMMLLRSMAPRVVAVDELGGDTDVYAVEQVLKCGCSVLATVHGSSWEELFQKRFLEPLLSAQAFERFFVLGKMEGRYAVLEVRDGSGALLTEGLLC